MSSVIRKNFLAISLAAIVTLTGVSLGQTSSQTPSNNSAQRGVDQDIDLLRQDIRSHKKQIIAANLQLTDAEAVKFWPLYDQYTAELVKINDPQSAVIKEYAINYDTLTDDKALTLTRQLLDVDQQVAQLGESSMCPWLQQGDIGKEDRLFFPDGSPAVDVDRPAAGSGHSYLSEP